MGLLNEVEKRSFRGRLFRATVILVLAIGSVTMIYPFLLMLATSVTSDIDYKEYRLVPRYLTSDAVLFRKFLFERYGPKEIGQIKAKYRLGLVQVGAERHPVENYDDLASAVADTCTVGAVSETLLDDWQRFLKQLPEPFTRPYYITTFVDGTTQTAFQDDLYDTFGGDIGAFNKHVGAVLPYPDFRAIDVPQNTPNHHSWFPAPTPLKQLWREYKKGQPYTNINPVCTDQYYQMFLRGQYKTIAKLNETWGTSFGAFSQVRLVPTLPREPKRRAIWGKFVRLQFPWYYTRVRGDFTSQWRAFLVAKYGSERLYNALVDTISRQAGGTQVPYLSQTRFTPGPPQNEFLFKHWGEFLDRHVPAGRKRLVTVESRWTAFVRETYGTIASVNRAHGTAYASFDDLFPPYRQLDVQDFKDTKAGWRGYFLTHNYRRVLSFITTKGRALYNTVVLVVLSVVGSLVVQGIAAYALSRYRLSYSHQILLFLLATMAFPAEVGMIPSFLLLRELNLLNTFAALVLPGLCGGIGILYLKGYFDSLPNELFDSALIDGASEMQTFWYIVLPMAKPVLAVVALNVFRRAYTGFMWAFVTCQDPDMWTLMVWLYQFQQKASVSTQMAAFVVAAMPTLLMFIMCQKIIMRGIVIPTMK